MAYFFRPYYKLVKPVTMPTDWFYVENFSGQSQTLHILTTGQTNSHPEYSNDGGLNWTSLDTNNYLEYGEDNKIYFRSTDGWITGDSEGYFFNADHDIALGGNLARLVDWRNEPTSMPDYFFNRPFRYGSTSSHILDVSNITIGSLKRVGYYSLRMVFSNCSHITTAPDLSGLTSIDYGGMSGSFSNCSSLITAPDLSNVREVGVQALGEAYSLCYNLTEATAPNVQDLTQDNVLNFWLSSAGTQATGTKVVNVPTGATIATGSDSGIPTGWTRLDY